MASTTRHSAKKGTVKDNGHSTEIGHGAVVIAAITSCTNTSNPSVMLAAGLVREEGGRDGPDGAAVCEDEPRPGSRVVTDYLDQAGLTEPLAKLGFHTVGYGCTTCIGNSGPLPDPVAAAVNEGNLVASAVLSGNRNFEGRVNPLVKANYLASPPLVVAYALAGTTDIDLTNEPIGTGTGGKPVYLKDIWPTNAEVQAGDRQRRCCRRCSQSRYADVFAANETWNADQGGRRGSVPVGRREHLHPGAAVPGRPDGRRRPDSADCAALACLAVLGDSVTTDHISPAGNISKNSPAGKFLMDHGVQPADFNSYGSRRGNDRVMVRGTFANIRIRNFLAPGTEGGVTKYLGPAAVHAPVSAAEAHLEAARQQANAALRSTTAQKPAASTQTSTAVPLAKARMSGEGGGSLPPAGDVSQPAAPQAHAERRCRHRQGDFDLRRRDEVQGGRACRRSFSPARNTAPAARATGPRRGRTCSASGRSSPTSFERIHRSNLVNMGVLPLQFLEGPNLEIARPHRRRDLRDRRPRRLARSRAARSPSTPPRPMAASRSFEAHVRIDTPVELDYYKNGGILQTVVRKLL